MLIECIESIRTDETHFDTPLIVVYDGGIDDNAIRLALFKMGVKLVFNPGEHGVAQALNYGLKFVDTEFVRRIDADDLWIKHELPMAIFQSNPNLAVIAGRAVPFSDAPELKIISLPPMKSGYISTKHFLAGNLLSHPATYIRRDFLLEVGGYSDACPSEDFHLWLNFLKKDKEIYFTSNPYVLYRRHPEQISNRLNSSISSEVLFNDWQSGLPHDLKVQNRDLKYILCQGNVCEHNSRSHFEYFQYVFKARRTTFWKNEIFLNKVSLYGRLLTPLYRHSKVLLVPIGLINPFVSIACIFSSIRITCENTHIKRNRKNFFD